MSGPEIRADLAALVANVLPEEWTVYPGPPEVVSTPAAVIVPRTPYRRPGTYCQVTYGLAVTLLEARSTSTAGVDLLDDLAETVRSALSAVKGLAYESTELGPMIAPGGAEVYGATLNLELYHTEG